jgi:methionyl-tRNA formyltransferase
MRVGVIGRSQLLLRTIEHLRPVHDLAFIQTSRGEDYYGAGEEDFRRIAGDLGIPFVCSASTSGLAALAAETASEVAVSVNWPTLIPAAARDAFRHGVLNAHAGDLPRYRGNACPNWAILNFEPEVCLTIHRMTDELDAGPHLVKAFLPIDDRTYIGDIYAWMEERTPSLFAEALDRIGGPGFIEPDPLVVPSRMFPRRPEDARIDWRMPTRDILALVRASSRPFDGAFSTLEGERCVRIFRARSFEPGYAFSAVPGQVCLRHGGNPVVATGDGMIEIEECRCESLGADETAALVTRSLRNRLV